MSYFKYVTNINSFNPFKTHSIKSDDYVSPSGKIIYFTIEDMDQNVS